MSFTDLDLLDREQLAAVDVVGKLPASFTDLDGMRDWMHEHEPVLSEEDFWESEDHRVLWNHVLRPTRGDYPRAWKRRTYVAAVQWHTRAPAAGTAVRLLAHADRSANVCAEDLAPLGKAALTFNPEQAALQAVIAPDGKLRITYFGPN